MAEQEFRDFYSGWLEREELVHGSGARARFAATHTTLCGRSPEAFDRGYRRYLARRKLSDTQESFARYCGPRWRNHGLLHDQPPAVGLLPSAAAF